MADGQAQEARSNLLQLMVAVCLKRWMMQSYECGAWCFCVASATKAKKETITILKNKSLSVPKGACQQKTMKGAQ